MEVGIRVVSEEIRTRKIRHVNSGYFTMVAVDDSRNPILVKKLLRGTPDEIRRHSAAMKRREVKVLGKE